MRKILIGYLKKSSYLWLLHLMLNEVLTTSGRLWNHLVWKTSQQLKIYDCELLSSLHECFSSFWVQRDYCFLDKGSMTWFMYLPFINEYNPLWGLHERWHISPCMNQWVHKNHKQWNWRTSKLHIWIQGASWTWDIILNGVECVAGIFVHNVPILVHCKNQREICWRNIVTPKEGTHFTTCCWGSQTMWGCKPNIRRMGWWLCMVWVNLMICWAQE